MERMFLKKLRTLFKILQKEKTKNKNKISFRK